jgi:cell division septal protein FtsQ
MTNPILTLDEKEVLKRIAHDVELDIEVFMENHRVFDLPESHELYQRLNIVDKILAHVD